MQTERKKTWWSWRGRLSGSRDSLKDDLKHLLLLSALFSVRTPRFPPHRTMCLKYYYYSCQTNWGIETQQGWCCNRRRNAVYSEAIHPVLKRSAGSLNVFTLDGCWEWTIEVLDGKCISLVSAELLTGTFKSIQICLDATIQRRFQFPGIHVRIDVSDPFH